MALMRAAKTRALQHFTGFLALALVWIFLVSISERLKSIRLNNIASSSHATHNNPNKNFNKVWKSERLATDISERDWVEYDWKRPLKNSVEPPRDKPFVDFNQPGIRYWENGLQLDWRGFRVGRPPAEKIPAWKVHQQSVALHVRRNLD